MKKLTFIVLLFSIIYLYALETCDFSQIDSTTTPKDDFYQFACGKWIKENSIPNGKHRFGFYDLAQQKIDNQLVEMMEKCVMNPQTKIEAIIGDFYSSASDSTLFYNSNLRSLKGLIKKIQDISDKEALAVVFLDLIQMDINPMIKIHNYKYWEVRGIHHLYFANSSLSLEEPKNYLSNEDNSSLKDLRTLVKFYLSEFDYPEKEAELHAESILSIETELAAIYNTQVNSFNAKYNEFSIADLKEDFPNYNWDYLMESLNNKDDKIVVSNPKVFAFANNLIETKSLEKLKAYLIWNVINSFAKYLPSTFSDRYYALKRSINSYEQKPNNHENFVMKTVSNSLPELTGHLYTKYYFDKQDKEEVEILVENLRSAFLDRIGNNPWLSLKAKKLVSGKISALKTKIGGYPIDTLSYGDLDLTSDFLLNILESKRYSNTVTQLRNGKTIDDSEWTVYPHSTNAWYGTSRNDLTFPAGNINMLFDRNAEPAENYAKLGATIAHEMTHAVDNTGRLYDKNGDYIKWWRFSQKWKSNDIKQFESRSQKLIKLYSNFTLLDTLYLNGKNTLGENIADLGGLNIAFDTFRNTIKDHKRVLINGYTPEQRFFISYAQKWADNLSPTLQTFYVKYFMHSPPKYRTNGVLYNIDKFYEVFNITTGKRASIKIW